MPSRAALTRHALPVLALAALFGQASAADSSGRVCAPHGGSRPSIGLVLSGGGARGGAHIGVLEALERLRVPVDCIAGTSVGAVLGGFYAAGLTVAEIEDVARNAQWTAAATNAMPRRYESFRRKQDDRLLLMRLQPGLHGGKLTLPIGLVQGQIVDMTIERAVLGAYAVHDFDRLTVPFRAVATDLATGKPVVLRSGELAMALRASMSLPAMLPPVAIDGETLVDGGLAMNLPIEIAKEMGADIVIAVDVASAPETPEKLHSALDIASQLSTLLTQPALERQTRLLGPNDFLISPEIDRDVTFASFDAFMSTLSAGFDAVMAESARLADVALDAQDYAAYRAALSAPHAAERPVIDFVRLDNRTTIADSVLSARLRGVEIGKPIDAAAVDTAIGKVYGLGYFQDVRYGLETDAAGVTGLVVRADQRSWGPGYLQFGMRYGSSSAADTAFALDASYLRTGIDARGGEWRATVALGDEPAAIADFFQPLGAGGAYFVEPELAAQSTIFNVFTNDHVAAATDIREIGFEIGAGRDLDGNAEIRGGLRSASGDYRLRIGDPALLPGDRFRVGEVFVRFAVDTLDNVVIPRSGFDSTVEWRRSQSGVLAADASFEQILLDTAFAKSWRRNTLLTSFRYDTTTDGTAPVHSEFRLGGFRDLSGLIRNQLSGQQAARMGLSYYRKLGGSAVFPAFAGVTLERGNVWNERREMRFADAIGAASIWGGVGTPIGPVYLGVGRTDDRRRAVYLSLGTAF